MGSAPERIVVGRIVKPHGIRGEVVVEILSDAPNRFQAGATFEAGDPDGPTTPLTIEHARDDRGRLLVTFAEVRDRDAVDDVRGKLLTIPIGDAAPPPEGAYYAWQIEGLDVYDDGGARLGTVARVLERAGNDVWVIDTARGEAMVPAVEEFIRSVDLAAKRIVIHIIPGLIE